ncbi:MAG TPA: hypothetical protein VFK57_02010 [Vicinamibacterales bacterium]|nr:hypothetical protein [Vicinamibacterales bacterium]
MKSRFAAACLLATLAAAGCNLPFLNGKDKDETSSPTGPSPAGSLDAFAGTWSSVNASNPATGCGNVKYTVTPTNATSANVTFTATCAGNIAVSGSGAGTLSGDAINWSAAGLVSQGGVNCPFTFTNSRATLGADGNVTVNYTGTVCGIPVSGTEVVKK